MVNTASRTESEGLPGAIQLTEATYNLIKDDLLCSERVEITVKGKGTMLTYMLISNEVNRPTDPVASPKRMD